MTTSLYADEIPVWLSIHKREQVDYRESLLYEKLGRHSIPIILKSPGGDLVKYPTRKKAASVYDCSVAALKDKIMHARKRDPKYINLGGVKYILVEG